MQSGAEQNQWVSKQVLSFQHTAAEWHEVQLSWEESKYSIVTSGVVVNWWTKKELISRA
jgi:hypothetical protein